MFTGIVTGTARVASVEGRGKNRHVTFVAPRTWTFMKSESISVDGICSTVVTGGRGRFAVDYMPTTLAKTTAAEFEKGRIVNLERPLMWRGRVDGYFVLGHVDGIGEIQKTVQNTLVIQIPKALMRYVVPRGSLTVNGVALTVVDVAGRLVTIALIPYTRRHTNLGSLMKGDLVNIEIDLLARYATKALRKRN